MKKFPEGRPMVPSSSALDLYARHFEPLEWSAKLNDTIMEQYRKLTDVWQHLPGTSSKWGNAKAFKTKPLRGEPRDAYKGRCGDFAVKLKQWLIEKGIDHQALRLVTCEIVTKDGREPHIVLAVLTTEADLICCNIRGCWPLISEAWDNDAVRYDWKQMEGDGPGWVNIAEQTLDEVLEMIG